MALAQAHTHYVRPIISGDWIFSVTIVVVRSEDHTSLRWIANTILSISPALSAPQSLAPKTATMSTKTKSIVTTIIQRGLRKGVQAVKLPY